MYGVTVGCVDVGVGVGVCRWVGVGVGVFLEVLLYVCRSTMHSTD